MASAMPAKVAELYNQVRKFQQLFNIPLQFYESCKISAYVHAFLPTDDAKPDYTISISILRGYHYLAGGAL